MVDIAFGRIGKSKYAHYHDMSLQVCQVAHSLYGIYGLVICLHFTCLKLTLWCPVVSPLGSFMDIYTSKMIIDI